MSGANGRERQQVSKKDSAVFSLCVVIACICLSVALVGCSQSGTATNGGASSGSTNASSSTSSQSSDVNGVDESDYVGSWRVTRIAFWDEKSGKYSNEKGYSPKVIKAARKKGIENYIVLNPDGSAVYVTMGIYGYGTWKIDDETFKGLGTGALIDLSYPDGGSLSLFALVDGSKLSVTSGYTVISCKKAKDKKPLSKDEHDAALEAFVGTWHLMSATRYGVTITKESGQLTADATLDFKNTMSVTMTYNGETRENKWGITGANSGYIFNPVDGDLLTISDGVLTEDMGDVGTMSYVKE